MKIADIRLDRLIGRPGDDWPAASARSVGPLDFYEEFRRQGPTVEAPSAKPRRIEAIFLEIACDDGTIGTYGPLFPESAAIIAGRLRPVLIGRDGLAGEFLWDVMSRCDRHARAGHMMMAISAVDCALWDLKGRHFGLPVYRLLGGSRRESVPAYASMLGFPLAPDLAQQQARKAVDEGFAGQKWFFRRGPSDGPAGRRENLDLAAALREAVGEDVDLMFDCWMGWSLPYAVDLAAELGRLRIRWLEEPLPPGHLDGFRELKRRTGLPLAAGEHMYTRWDVKPFLDAGVLDVVQADPDWTGGITELVKICDLAATYDVPVVPHGHSAHAAMHVIASRSPDVCPMAEYLLQHLQRHQFFLKNPIRPDRGRITMPTEPGLGMDIDESKVLERRRFEWT